MGEVGQNRGLRAGGVLLNIRQAGCWLLAVGSYFGPKGSSKLYSTNMEGNGPKIRTAVFISVQPP